MDSNMLVAAGAALLTTLACGVLAFELCWPYKGKQASKKATTLMTPEMEARAYAAFNAPAVMPAFVKSSSTAAAQVTTPETVTVAWTVATTATVRSSKRASRKGMRRVRCSGRIFYRRLR